MSNIRERLREDLSTAMRGQDRDAVRVLRSALSAIGNAEAQPNQAGATTSPRAQGTIAGAAVGVGASDVARRVLGEPEIRNVLEAERRECLAAAEVCEAGGRYSEAAAGRADAAMLEQYLQG